MKQAIENLNLLYINQKPISNKVKFLLLVPLIIIIMGIYNYTWISPEKYPDEFHQQIIIIKWVILALIVVSAIFLIILGKNFIEDKKGDNTYIGYDAYYLQFRLPVYRIFPAYFLSRKKEDSILISDIQSIKLKRNIFHLVSIDSLITGKIETCIIIVTQDTTYKLLILTQQKDINQIVKAFEQFVESKNISIKSFRY